MSNFPDLLTDFDNAVQALKVKLSQDPDARITYNGEEMQSIAADVVAQYADIKDELNSLAQGQQSGVIVFQSYAALTAYTPTTEQETGSFKVASDPDTSLNGYYSWVSGTTYTKDADLVVNQVNDDNMSDAISGAAVRRYVKVENVASITPNLLDEANALAGFYVEETGAVKASTSYRASDYIKVDVGALYNLYRDSGGLVAGRTRKTCYYDANYNVVAGGSSDTVSSFTPPAGVAFVRLSTYQEDYDAGEKTTLVKASEYPSPVVFPYYARTKTNEAVATKLYGAVVENEGVSDDSVMSKKNIEERVDTTVFNAQTANVAPYNYAINGNYVGGDADTRSASIGVDLTNQTDLLSRGFTRAMQWKTNQNEYVRCPFGSGLLGKYITAGFLCYSDNPDNLVLNSFIYSENAAGTLQDGVTQYINNVSLSDTLMLVYRQVLVTQTDAVNAMIGSTSKPVDNTRFATGFTTFITDEPLTELELLSYLAANDLTRATSKDYAEATRKVVLDTITDKYKAQVQFGGPDALTTIVGSKYTRKVLPFKNVETIDSRVFNFKEDYIGDTALRDSTGDDVAPIHAFGTTLMANHSYFGCLYSVPSHGKTDDDIGAIYSHSGNQFVLVSVPSENSLFFADIDSNSDNYPTYATLTYVSGGSNTSSVAVTTKSFRQIYPCHKDYSMSILIDGKPHTDITATVEYNESLVFNETYTLLKREDIINWYLSGDTLTPPTGDSQLIQTVSYQFDWEGNCTIVADYTCAYVFTMADIMALQAVELESLTEYYIPKTVEFDYKGTPRNFSMIEPSTVCTDAGGDTSILFTSEKLDASPIKSDRWLQLGADGVFAMGFLPLGSAGTNRDVNITTHTMEIRSNTNKMYPRLLDKGDFTTSVGDSWGCVAYRIVHVPHEGATATYPVRTQGDDYYFIDYHNTNDLVSIPMPDDYVGREFEVVESRNITCVSTVVSHQLSCLVNCAGDYGYLVLKVKR